MIADEVLDRLLALSERCNPGPWTASIEGRDHASGDSFIQTGSNDARAEDLYVTRDSGPAGSEYLELIAAARTYLPALIEEVRASRRS